MDKKEHEKTQIRIRALYDGVPDSVKEDLGLALDWARVTLTTLEGAGHQFNVLASSDECVVCSFAKPEWSGDHCGDEMEDGAQAVVRAVCEYLDEKSHD